MPFHLERIYSIVAGSPEIPEFFVSYPLNKITIYIYSLLFCQYTKDSCKDETVFPNINMPLVVIIVLDCEL